MSKGFFLLFYAIFSFCDGCIVVLGCLLFVFLYHYSVCLRWFDVMYIPPFFFSSNIDNYDICIIFFRFHSVFSLCHFNVLTYVCIAYNLYEYKRKKPYTVFLFKRILFIFFPFQSHMEKTSDNEITTRTYFRLKLVFQLILFIIWF